MMEEVLSFLTVLAVAVGVASAIGILYATGLRLLYAGQTEGPAESNNASAAHRIGAALCFGGCIAIVLYALYLIIPVFH